MGDSGWAFATWPPGGLGCTFVLPGNFGGSSVPALDQMSAPPRVRDPGHYRVPLSSSGNRYNDVTRFCLTFPKQANQIPCKLICGNTLNFNLSMLEVKTDHLKQTRVSSHRKLAQDPGSLRATSPFWHCRGPSLDVVRLITAPPPLPPRGVSPGGLSTPRCPL